MTTDKIAFGGGCHWCTEAVFQALKGVRKVEQGYVASTNENQRFSEAVIVHFNAEIISLERLAEIHLYTHKSTSNHSFRRKYRSAIYFFWHVQETRTRLFLEKAQGFFSQQLIVEVLPFKEFKPSREALHNYYQKNPEKPFCKKFIIPKLKTLERLFSEDTVMNFSTGTANTKQNY